MKNYSNEELMISIRKKLAKKRPDPGELVQGIVFSMLTSLEHLKGAEQLLDQNMLIPGYGALINAVEELGKINRLADILVNWEQPEKAEEFKSKQKSHPWKLSGALEVFSKIVSSEGTTFGFSGVIQEWLQGGDPVEFMLKYIDPKAAENYHDLRLKISYTNFDGQRVSSPYHSLQRIEPEICKMVVVVLKVTIEKLMSVSDKILPIYMDLIRRCYLESDPQKVTSLKTEINRRVRRTLPAFRKYMDAELKKQTGKDIDEWAEQSQEDIKRVYSELGDIKTLVQAIAKLIVSDEFIEEIYFYPPLKNSAKEFYQKFKDEED